MIDYQLLIVIHAQREWSLFLFVYCNVFYLRLYFSPDFVQFLADVVHFRLHFRSIVMYILLRKPRTSMPKLLLF